MEHGPLCSSWRLLALGLGWVCELEGEGGGCDRLGWGAEGGQNDLQEASPGRTLRSVLLPLITKLQIRNLLGAETHFPTLYSPDDSEPNSGKGLPHGFN